MGGCDLFWVIVLFSSFLPWVAFFGNFGGAVFGWWCFFGVTKAVGGMAWAFPLGCCLVSGYIFSEIDEDDDDEMGEDVTNVLLFFVCM
jgi:hypothetical protein